VRDIVQSNVSTLAADSTACVYRQNDYWHLHSGAVTQEAPALALTASPGLQLAALPVVQETEHAPQFPTAGAEQLAPWLFCRLIVLSLLLPLS
jgi:hypothetical protein